jgi:predicted DNA-binding mobile mystery protein A
MALLKPDSGWIKLMREALGMTSKQLAKRVGIDQSRITRLENAETAGDLKLSSLKKIAESMDMHFVYGFVPKIPLEEMVQAQARKIAGKRIKHVNHTMLLEDQELSEEEKAKALSDLTEKILVDEPKDFWEQ